jgi:hypothetical protein
MRLHQFLPAPAMAIVVNLASCARKQCGPPKAPDRIAVERFADGKLMVCRPLAALYGPELGSGAVTEPIS